MRIFLENVYISNLKVKVSVRRLNRNHFAFCIFLGKDFFRLGLFGFEMRRRHRFCSHLTLSIDKQPVDRVPRSPFGLKIIFYKYKKIRKLPGQLVQIDECIYSC